MKDGEESRGEDSCGEDSCGEDSRGEDNCVEDSCGEVICVASVLGEGSSREKSQPVPLKKHILRKSAGLRRKLLALSAVVVFGPSTASSG